MKIAAGKYGCREHGESDWSERKWHVVCNILRLATVRPDRHRFGFESRGGAATVPSLDQQATAAAGMQFTHVRTHARNNGARAPLLLARDVTRTRSVHWPPCNYIIYLPTLGVMTSVVALHPRSRSAPHHPALTRVRPIRQVLSLVFIAFVFSRLCYCLGK